MEISKQIEILEGIRKGTLDYIKSKNKFSFIFFLSYGLQIVSFFFFILLFLEYVSKEIIKHFEHIKTGYEAIMVEQSKSYDLFYNNIIEECFTFLKNPATIQDYVLLSAFIFFILYSITNKFNFFSKRKKSIKELKDLYKNFVVEIFYLPMIKELFPNTKIKQNKHSLELDHIYSLKNVNIKLENKRIEVVVKDNLFTKKREEKEGGITTQTLRTYEELKGIKEVEFNQKRFRVEVILTLSEPFFDLDLKQAQLGSKTKEENNINIQRRIIELVKQIEENIVDLYY